MESPKEVYVTHNTPLKLHSPYVEGDLIKFKYKRGSEESFSYSKITKVIPKIEDDKTIKLHFLTENEKFIVLEDIMSLEVKNNLARHYRP